MSHYLETFMYSTIMSIIAMTMLYLGLSQVEGGYLYIALTAVGGFYLGHALTEALNNP
jgi:uncharacterized membrane protein